MSVATHYDTLKVTRDAPAEVITSVYKALAQKYHPDRNQNSAEAVQMMQMINEAYRVLSDARKKSDHDAWIRQQDPPKAPPALSPKEQELKKKSDETAADAKKWRDWADKTAAEAKSLRDKANKVAEQLKNASPSQKAAFQSMYAREDADAKSAEGQAQEALKKAQASAEIAMKNAFSKDGRLPPTHYDTLKVTHDAPAEVLQAAARVLSTKYQNENNDSALASVNNAYAFLTDAKKKAEHDAWIKQQMPKEQAQAQAVRKPTGREIDAKAKADKAEADAVALEAYADRVIEEEKAAQVKAEEAAKTATQRVKEKDAAAWKTWAEKTALEAKQHKDRAAKASAKAAEARLKAQAAKQELDDAKTTADREAAMWNK